jgi:tetratricopeptide (TPR) repeat protein
MPSTLDIFCCYAREDQPLLHDLISHLMPLQWQGLIKIWHDADIGAGSEWEEEINKHLNTAQIILLLISSDFMASEYCYSKEMHRAMQRHERNDTRVVPVLLRPTYWKGAPFEKLQMLPDEARAVTVWLNKDEALYNVTERLSSVVNELMIKNTLIEAESLYADQSYEGALIIYNQLIGRELDLAPAYMGKGKTLFALKRYEESLRAYEKAFQINPKIADSRFYQDKAQMLYHIQRYEESLKAYQEAIRCNPVFAEVYIEKAKVLFQLQRYEEAFEMYEQAIRLEPTEAEYYVQAGDTLLMLKRFEQALDQYGHAIELKPEEVGYYDKKGEVLLDLKRFEEALSIYDKLLDIISKQPDFVEPFVSYYDKKGRALLELHRYEEAFAAYEQCIQDYGAGDPYIYYRKGKALFGLERYEEALVACDESIRLGGIDADPEFYQAKGVVHERLAQQAYEMAVQKRSYWQPGKIKSEETIRLDDIDTVVVPAREEGFQNTFLKENRWLAIRMHSSMRPQIKYIAVYQVAPQSAITHVAPVSSIEPWEEDSSRFVVNFAEPARKIGPIPLSKNGIVKAPQNLRYTNYERLLNAQTLDDIWGQNGVNALALPPVSPT